MAIKNFTNMCYSNIIRIIIFILIGSFFEVTSSAWKNRETEKMQIFTHTNDHSEKWLHIAREIVSNRTLEINKVNHAIDDHRIGNGAITEASRKLSENSISLRTVGRTQNDFKWNVMKLHSALPWTRSTPFFVADNSTVGALLPGMPRPNRESNINRQYKNFDNLSEFAEYEDKSNNNNNNDDDDNDDFDDDDDIELDDNDDDLNDVNISEEIDTQHTSLKQNLNRNNVIKSKLYHNRPIGLLKETEYTDTVKVGFQNPAVTGYSLGQASRPQQQLYSTNFSNLKRFSDFGSFADFSDSSDFSNLFSSGIDGGNMRRQIVDSYQDYSNVDIDTTNMGNILPTSTTIVNNIGGRELIRRSFNEQTTQTASLEILNSNRISDIVTTTYPLKSHSHANAIDLKSQGDKGLLLDDRDKIRLTRLKPTLITNFATLTNDLPLTSNVITPSNTTPIDPVLQFTNYPASISNMSRILNGNKGGNSVKSSKGWHFDDSTVRRPKPTIDDFQSVISQAGSHAYLPCNVKQLVKKPISWLRVRDGHILTVDQTTFIADQRFQSIYTVDPERWSLQIKYVHINDAGTYECQVSTEPKTSAIVYLFVIEPRTAIVGPATRHVKAGSEVKLHCIISQALEPPLFINWFHNQKQIYLHDHPGWRSEIERIELPPKMTTTTITSTTKTKTKTTVNSSMNNISENTFISASSSDSVSKGVNGGAIRTSSPIPLHYNPITSISSDSSTPSVFNTSEFLLAFNSQDILLTTEISAVAQKSYLELAVAGNVSIKQRNGNDNFLEESSTTVTDWSSSLSNQTGINELWTTIEPEDLKITETTTASTATTTTTTDYHVTPQMPMQPNIDVKQITSASLIIPSIRRQDSGNYSCRPSNSQPRTVVLHVLNGEYSASAITSGAFLSSCRPATFVFWMVGHILASIRFCPKGGFISNNK